MSSIFSKIVAGDIPCYKVAETEDFLAFLDVNPLAAGHTLVIPKREINYIFDIEDDMYQSIFLFAKKVAKSLENVTPCLRIGIAVVGLEVPHAHIHLVPLNDLYDMDFKKPRVKLSSQEYADIAAAVAQAYDTLY